MFAATRDVMPALCRPHTKQAQSKLLANSHFGHKRVMIISIRPRLAALAAIAVITLAAFAPAFAAKVGSAHFDGLVTHVSTNNIKVQNPKTKEALSFLLLPHFRSVFSDNGKTTMQMAALKPGQYVKVYYDQKLFGARHADRILILNNANMKMGKQGG
ncbi:MAG: hypothetical protein NVSMB64_24650 [Candidatus Velthaea sp.]